MDYKNVIRRLVERTRPPEPTENASLNLKNAIFDTLFTFENVVLDDNL